MLVLKFVFFKLDEKGLEFFWDFCWDLILLLWILWNLGFLLFEFEIFNGRWFFSFEFGEEFDKVVIFCKEVFVESNGFSVDEIL